MCNYVQLSTMYNIMYNYVQLCTTIKWIEKNLFNASCLKNKNVLKVEAGMLEKKERFKNGLSLRSHLK